MYGHKVNSPWPWANNSLGVAETADDECGNFAREVS